MTLLHQAGVLAASALVGLGASTVVSDTVLVAMIAAIAPTLTGIALIMQNKKNMSVLVAGQSHTQAAVQEVHILADGRLSQALGSIEALKTEVSRLNAGGAPSPPSLAPGLSVSQSPDGQTKVEHSLPPLPAQDKK